MKSKIVFIVILCALAAGIFLLTYGQNIVVDCIGAVLLIAAGAVQTIRLPARSQRPRLLAPLWIGITIFILIGFIQFKGAILLAAAGYVTIGLYLFFKIKRE